MLTTTLNEIRKHSPCERGWCTRLAAAEARVAELEGLLRSHRSALVCDNLHHSSKQYHLASQKCPVEAEIDAALDRARRGGE